MDFNHRISLGLKLMLKRFHGLRYEVTCIEYVAVATPKVQEPKFGCVKTVPLKAIVAYSAKELQKLFDNVWARR